MTDHHHELDLPVDLVGGQGQRRERVGERRGELREGRGYQRAIDDDPGLLGVIAVVEADREHLRRGRSGVAQLDRVNRVCAGCIHRGRPRTEPLPDRVQGADIRVEPALARPSHIDPAQLVALVAGNQQCCSFRYRCQSHGPPPDLLVRRLRSPA